MTKLLNSRYNATGERCVDACLSYGELRYLSNDGTPVNIEIPYDKYEEARTDFSERIKEGLVNSDISPSEVLKMGSFTYNQVKNIAVLNKIKGINFFDIDGSIEIDHILGMSGGIEYALAVWNGDEKEDALVKAIIRAIKIHGSKFIKSLKLDEEDKNYDIFCNNIQKLEHLTGSELYRFKICKIENEDYNKGIDVKKKLIKNTNFIIGIIGSLIGFILVQGFTNFGSVVNNIFIHWGINIVVMAISAILTIKIIKSISNKYVQQSNNSIVEMFNEELELSNFNNLITENEYKTIHQNITKGEVSKLIMDMRGSVNKKISINKVISKETEFILESRTSIFLPNEIDVKEMTESLIKKHYNEIIKDCKSESKTTN